MASTPPSKTKTVPAKPAVATPIPAAQDTRSYLVMMLLTIFLMPTGLARAYRGEQIGWIRFWVLIGAYVVMLVPVFVPLSFLAIAALHVWGFIDVFLLRTTTTDAAGKPLATTPTDNKWAKGFFIYVIISVALFALLVIAAISFGWMMAVKCQTDPASSWCGGDAAGWEQRLNRSLRDDYAVPHESF